MIEANPDKIDWTRIWCNPNAMHLLHSKKKNSRAWWHLNGNPGAMYLLEKNPAKIDFTALSSNTSPVAMAILEKNLAYANWPALI